ncbi:RNA 2',3'-cyclic phosphodiesterase [Peribacillus sp. SCS-37]|uniref:RNA 2',3'-cyclic phosphodiesterase n=1 Tax=Paraperibacillus esterisolvens TaxID=3115296 RepID=UPI003905CA08
MAHSNYFYAVKLPDAAKQYIQDVFKKSGDHLPFKKWVHPADYHITLAFLGKADELKLEESINKAADIARKRKPFELMLDGVGTFGPVSAPRILWAGVKAVPELFELQQAVYSACEESGFSLDKKSFKPHITTARKYTGDEKFFKENLPMLGEFIFTADRFTLYKTNMGESPSYETVYDFALIE